MSVKRFSVENERLGIDFGDEVRPVFIKGETKNGVFHVRTEDFEHTQTFLIQIEKKLETFLETAM